MDEVEEEEMIKTLFQRKVMEEQNIFIQTMSRQGRESKFNIKRQNKKEYLKMTEYIYYFPPNDHLWLEMYK